MARSFSRDVAIRSVNLFMSFFRTVDPITEAARLVTGDVTVALKYISSVD